MSAHHTVIEIGTLEVSRRRSKKPGVKLRRCNKPSSGKCAGEQTKKSTMNGDDESESDHGQRV